MNQNNDPTHDDRLIAGLVQSVRINLPPELDEKVTAALQEENRETKGFTFKPFFKRITWLPVTAMATALILLAALFIFQPFTDSSRQQLMDKPISEIKTEIYIQDKNIKILWVQKQDFKLEYKKGV